jgi:hypothetical protein
MDADKPRQSWWKRPSRIETPYFGLARYGRDRVPSVVFTSSRDRGEFLRLAGWICRDFGGEVVERYGGDGEDHKEYWTIRVGEARWMLCRCFFPRGISLDTDLPSDLPAFEEIARLIGARSVGWRYRWLRLRRKLLKATGLSRPEP